MGFRRTAGLLATVAAGAAVAAGTVGASGSALSGTITADGSSTVGPYTTAAAEGFQKKNPKVRVTVGISGTGGGFERFCKGEIDISNASRKIKQGAGSEAEKCKNEGIRYVAFAVANDGLSVVVNKQNTWASCLTVAELKKIWEPGSKVDNWKDVRAGFPDQKLKLFGAGTDSGTFDYFTEAIMGKAKASRGDYQATEDDNVTVQGVSGEKGAMGYFGFSYFEENQDKLKLLAVDGGGGCVRPSVRSVQNRTYKPLGRPLFVYVKASSFKRAEVQGFVDYILDNEKAIAKKARFIPLTTPQLKNAKRLYKYAVINAKKG
jgi:phosphate transport system substrate-binding protein